MAEGAGFEPAVELPLRLISSQVPSTNSATLPVMPVSQVSLLEAYFNESDGRKQVYCRNVVDWCLVTRESD